MLLKIREGKRDWQRRCAAIHRSLELGVNWIDTAAVYGLGHSEEAVARGLKAWCGIFRGMRVPVRWFSCPPDYFRARHRTLRWFIPLCGSNTPLSQLCAACRGLPDPAYLALINACKALASATGWLTQRKSLNARKLGPARLLLQLNCRNQRPPSDIACQPVVKASLACE